MHKRTALFKAHKKLGARLINFGGWEMPVHYSGLVAEHTAVRTAAGIFDISHMSEVTVSGSCAEAFLNHVLTNDLRKLTSGHGQYTLMCNERGGVIDDLYCYKLSTEVYLLIINAARAEADAEWLKKQYQQFSERANVFLTDTSHNYSAVAVQGPRVKEFIDDCISGGSMACVRVNRVTDLHKNQIGEFSSEGGGVLVSRTGYTGEDGFEIIGGDWAISRLWEKILKIGEPFGIKPCGLGARDTLRTEACYPLYGNELDEQTTPIEAGLGYFVALDKGDFVGREVLAKQKANGTNKKLVAFKMAEKSAPPRPHYPILAGGASVGMVTSGTQSPSLGIGIGMGYVPPGGANGHIDIEIRGKPFPAVIVPKPIYRKPK
ncbi:MAG TPA: glycine cleavage system aminomethyltransferase GcvT [Candidatus Sulfotelmatobacter sp.]|nr:glycine cleavage system aminomethyltransferase GcvT [Candidatus Sulfotelmatobacter sp.]